MQEAGAGTGERAAARDWVADSRRSLHNELRLWAATLATFLRAPARFVREWNEGGREFMNPLGFLALSVLILGTVRSFGWWYLARSGSSFALELAGDKPFWAELSQALGPSLHFAALGLIAHFTLRALGSRRADASSSAAMTFYSAGSAGLVFETGVWLVVLTLLATGVVPLARIYLPLFAGFGIALGGFCAYLGYTLGDLHRPRWWHMLLAFAAAFVLTGLFFGQVQPPGEYGIRWFLQLWQEGHWTFRLELRL